MLAHLPPGPCLHPGTCPIPMTEGPSLSGRLRRYAREVPGRYAVIDAAGTWSYGELDARVDEASEWLAAAGLGAADVVGVACDGDREHLVTTLALARLGAASVALSLHASDAERARLLERVGATAVVRADVERLAGVTPLPDVGHHRAVAAAKLLFATSGTTGEPKVVVHVDSGLVLQAPRHLTSGERFGCVVSMEHNFARRHRLYCVAEGATNVFLGAPREELVREAETLGLTTLHVTAFQARELLAVPGIGALGGRRVRLKLGGSHVARSLRDELRRRVTPVLQCGYGTTETGAIGFTDPEDDDAGESVGRALDGIEIRVLDGAGAALPPGETGLVAIRCDGMFLGYLGRPELSEARLVGGWFHTGDLGRLDERGRLHLAGRGDDVFVFNSMNIVPQDLEAAIVEHPAVVDAVVLPKRSPVHGDVPVALVVLAEGEAVDGRELKRFVRERAGLRCPRQFVPVDAVPRNAAGKIDRAAARALLAGAVSRA